MLGGGAVARGQSQPGDLRQARWTQPPRQGRRDADALLVEPGRIQWHGRPGRQMLGARHVLVGESAVGAADRHQRPEGRRALCYDHAAFESRKTAKPAGSAMDLAAEMGIELLNEEQYRYLQTLGEFDLKTSSWLNTPAPMRKLDGALFGDRRYDRVFVYHNSAPSYYGVRGFRGVLRV